ncbi:hypothetical protein DUNSADRAFT_8565, partial [Dunaliella salina]
MQLQSSTCKQAPGAALSAKAYKHRCKRSRRALHTGSASVISSPSSISLFPHTVTLQCRCFGLKVSCLQADEQQSLQHHQFLSISATDAGELRAPDDFQSMASAALLNSDRSACAAAMESGHDLNGLMLDGVPQLLLHLHDAEKALTAVMRPARYCQDFHPDAAWRAAAAAAYDTAAQALGMLHSRECFRVMLLRCERRLSAVVAEEEKVMDGLAGEDAEEGSIKGTIDGLCEGAAAGIGSSTATASAARATLEEGDGRTRTAERWAPWLCVCKSLLSAWDRGPDLTGPGSAERLSTARQYERQCSAALRQLLSDPAAAPKLTVHPQQVDVDGGWL